MSYILYGIGEICKFLLRIFTHIWIYTYLIENVRAVVIITIVIVAIYLLRDAKMYFDNCCGGGGWPW